MAREHAHVGSSDAIVEFRAALLTFQEEAQAAVDAIEMKAGQTLRFLDEDAPRYWDGQVRESYDKVNEARIALSICRNKTIAGRRSSCIEEKKAYTRAQDRLETSRTKRSATRATSIEAHEAADEFRARMAELHRLLEVDVPKLQALLHRTSVSLEAYTATRPPAAPELAAPSSDSDSEAESDPNDEDRGDAEPGETSDKLEAPPEEN